MKSTSRIPRNRLAIATPLAVMLLLVGHAAAQTVTITNYTVYVDVHYISVPNKNNALQAAWVYPSNIVRMNLTNPPASITTNLNWSNLNTYPALPPPAAHLFFKDYSITNRVPNRFRIYRQKIT